MRTFWTPKEDAVLAYLYPDNRTADILAFLPGKTLRGLYARADKLGLKKSPGLVARLAAEAMQNPNHGGRKAQFKKGESTWNKGKSYMPGGRCSENWFQKGRKPHTWNPVGHERITRDGILERKISDTGVTRVDYQPVHRLLWLEAGNSIPPGHIVVFKDGNRSNICIENLECISRQENMRRNSYHQYGAEVAKVVQLRGAITRQINKLEKSHEPKHQRSA
jgi:hypothetical protein